jgi:hypothetical protein
MGDLPTAGGYGFRARWPVGKCGVAAPRNVAEGQRMTQYDYPALQSRINWKIARAGITSESMAWRSSLAFRCTHQTEKLYAICLWMAHDQTFLNIRVRLNRLERHRFGSAIPNRISQIVDAD